VTRPHDGVNVTSFGHLDIGQADLWLEIGERGATLGRVSEVRYGDARFLGVLWPGPCFFDAVFDPDLPFNEVRLVHEGGAETRLIDFALRDAP
jgi:hypothetical protein